ncbi:putative membrane protein [Streptomyces davaonensis JCM 4913]|uniref:Putative membrane protein n=2 Tax=Streptomyces davaonensis TaxID=348043 RepID=K4R6D2_STRDJ|nr:putative membrane protein [Streptomyces davaonensis JCM 4913]
MLHWMLPLLESEDWIEMLRYTLMRLGIFAGCLVVVWGLVYSGVMPRGLGDSNGMWVILLALLISAPISFVVLRKERDRASVQIVERVDRVKANLEANRTQEDVADDATRAQGQTS